MQTLNDFLQFRSHCPFCKDELYITLNNSYDETLQSARPLDLQELIYKKTFVKDFIVGYQIRVEDGYYIAYCVEDGIKKQLSDTKYKILREYLKNKKSHELEVYCYKCFYHLICKIQIELETQKVIFSGDIKEIFDADDMYEIENHITNKSSSIWKGGHEIQVEDTYLDPTDPAKLKKDLQMLLLFQ